MKTLELFAEMPASQKKPGALLPTPQAEDRQGPNGSQHTLGRMAKRGDLLLNPLMFSSADSHARILAWQERARALTEHGAVFGGSSTDLLVSFDPAMCAWKTWQRSLFEDFPRYLGRFPRSGMMRNGRLFQRPQLVPRTLENVCSLWPTPRTTSLKGGPGHRDMIQAKLDQGILTAEEATALATVKMWPTPQARDSAPRGAQAKRYHNPERSNDLPDAVAASGKNGQLNPTWVEWLMGFPEGWTGLED